MVSLSKWTLSHHAGYCSADYSTRLPFSAVIHVQYTINITLPNIHNDTVARAPCILQDTRLRTASVLQKIQMLHSRYQQVLVSRHGRCTLKLQLCLPVGSSPTNTWNSITDIFIIFSVMIKTFSWLLGPCSRTAPGSAVGKCNMLVHKMRTHISNMLLTALKCER